MNKTTREDIKKVVELQDPTKMTYGELMYSKKELKLHLNTLLPQRMNRKDASKYYTEKLNRYFNSKNS